MDKSPLEEYLHELYNEKQECDLKTVEPVPLRTSWWLPLSSLRVVHHHFSHYGHMIKVVPFFMQVLHFKDQSGDALHKSYRLLHDAVNPQHVKYALHIANRLYGHEGFTFLQVRQ